ncbi:MAG: 1-deoxy-D-xylulose-5-phosphate reductoisomerase [Eubacteriales bacterium]
MSKKKIAILGSTGSIGTQTLDIVRQNEDLEVVAMAAGSNIVLLEQQIREFQPKYVGIWEEADALLLRERMKGLGIVVVSGIEGLMELASLTEVEMVVTAIVGMIGIRPTIAAIEHGKDIALANKETLVTAGHIIMPLAAKKGVSILPVDSEHSAIFQSLNGERKDRVHKLILTASGGPFRGRSYEQLQEISVEEALKHPNWSMGKKITIDSATLVNKGLEVIEAKWLFDVSLEQIEVVVHPQSMIHSMVEYLDGGIMAQIGMPDMKLPIQYALYYPDRKPMECERVDFFTLGQMTFEKPDRDTFHGLELAYEAARIGDSMPTIYNAANEKAVSLFLSGKLSFLGIIEVIESCMQQHKLVKNPNVEQILAVEQEAYEYIQSMKL